MQSHHVGRPPGAGGDRVEIESRGVGGQNGARFCRGIEPFEYLALDGHVLEDRLDDEVRLGDVLVRQRALDESDPSVEVGLGKPPFLERALVIPADHGQATIKRRLVLTAARSTFMPSSKGFDTAASTASMHLAGAG